MMVGYLYDLIIAIPVAIIIAIISMNNIGGEDKGVLVCLVLFVITALYATAGHIKSKARGLIFLIPVIAYAGLIMLAEESSRGQLLIELQWILWSALIAICGLLIAKLSSLNRWSTRLLAVVLIGYMIYSMPLGSKMNKVVVALSFFLLIVVVVIELQARWNKKGYTDMKSHIVYLSPFIIIPCLIIGLSNSPRRPYDWELAAKLWNSATESLKGRFSLLQKGDDEYWNDYIGFDENNRLAGSVDNEYRKIMELTAERRMDSPLYLRGIIYDTFVRDTWQINYTEASNEYLMDTMETLGAICKYDSDFTSRYMHDITVNFHFDMFNTRFLFLPAKARLGSDHVDEMSIVHLGDNFYFDKKRGYGTKYTMVYYSLNRTNPKFKDLLESASVIDSDVWSSVESKYFSLYDCDKSYESYLQYRDRIYQTYTEDIQLSDELRAYMDEVLDGAETDIEKLERIEEIFSDFKYTLTPGALPEDIDTASEYLDYFILEKRAGYCSYFATAFVLLARAEGIPARYVEGYYVKKANLSITAVTSDMAHAWPEVYIDGFGWISYEPTPGFKVSTGWDIDDGTITSVSSNHAVIIDESVKGTGDSTKEEEELSVDKPTNWRPVIIGAISAIFILLLIGLIDRVSVRYWYGKLENDKKHKVIYHRILHILSVLGYSHESGETLEELIDKINFTNENDEEKCLIPMSVKEFLEIREEIVYADKRLTSDEMEQAAKAYEDILLAMKTEKSWFLIRKSLIERIE